MTFQPGLQEEMSGVSLVARLLARRPARPSVVTVQTWRLYSPKGSQLPIVEEKRRRAMLGGGEKRLAKQHEKVREVVTNCLCVLQLATN